MGRLDRLRKVLALLPVVQASQGIRLADLSRQTGIAPEEIVSDLAHAVNLCGVPPYSPVDFVDLEIEGDRVSIRFAESFRRPVRLTLGEALALDMALAGWEELGEEPFAAAVASIRRKVREALSPEVAEEVEHAGRRISAVPPPPRAARLLALVKEALARQRELEMEYYSAGRGVLSRRTIRPYGVYEHAGRWYVVAWSGPSGEVRTFRVDRIRTAEIGKAEYEIPEEFDVSRYRLRGPPEPERPSLEARIRFRPDAARFARDRFPASEVREEEDGSVVVVVRASETAWLVSELLRWGEDARVLDPPGLEETVRERARRTLARYGSDA